MMRLLAVYPEWLLGVVQLAGNQPAAARRPRADLRDPLESSGSLAARVEATAMERVEATATERVEATATERVEATAMGRAARQLLLVQGALCRPAAQAQAGAPRLAEALGERSIRSDRA